MLDVKKLSSDKPSAEKTAVIHKMAVWRLKTLSQKQSSV